MREKGRHFDAGEHSKRREVARRALIVLIFIAAGGLLTIPMYAAQSLGWAQFASAVAVGITASASALLIGGLLGFLFGIPRRLQQRSTRLAGSRDSKSNERLIGSIAYEGNTNLEQISDWLTKILVGAGLIQIGETPQLLNQLGQFIVAGTGLSGATNTFAVGIVLLYLITGFLAGYLWTSLFLGEALAAAERAAMQPAPEKSKETDTVKRISAWLSSDKSNTRILQEWANKNRFSEKITYLRFGQSFENERKAAIDDLDIPELAE